MASVSPRLLSPHLGASARRPPAAPAAAAAAITALRHPLRPPPPLFPRRRPASLLRAPPSSPSFSAPASASASASAARAVDTDSPEWSRLERALLCVCWDLRSPLATSARACQLVGMGARTQPLQGPLPQGLLDVPVPGLEEGDSVAVIYEPGSYRKAVAMEVCCFVCACVCGFCELRARACAAGG